MAAADTNVLVRLLVADDARQLAVAKRALREHGTLFVTQIALVETAWVLSHTYGLSRRDVGGVIERLLLGSEFVVQGAEEVGRALTAFRRSTADFADCLLVENARSAGRLPVLTFDRALGRLPGALALGRSAR